MTQAFLLPRLFCAPTHLAGGSSNPRFRGGSQDATTLDSQACSTWGSGWGRESRSALKSENAHPSPSPTVGTWMNTFMSSFYHPAPKHHLGGASIFRKKPEPFPVPVDPPWSPSFPSFLGHLHCQPSLTVAPQRFQQHGMHGPRRGLHRLSPSA